MEKQCVTKKDAHCPPETEQTVYPNGALSSVQDTLFKVVKLAREVGGGQPARQDDRRFTL